MVSLNSPKKTRKAVKVEEEAPEDSGQQHIPSSFLKPSTTLGAFAEWPASLPAVAPLQMDVLTLAS